MIINNQTNQVLPFISRKKRLANADWLLGVNKMCILFSPLIKHQQAVID